MPKKLITELNGQRLKLSNLQKILYPSVGISKAEIIQYYIAVSPYLLKYLAGRPLSLIRAPDGIGLKQFYTKNRPGFTPDWMPSIFPPWDDENDYLYATEVQHIAWLANLAALEMHTSNSTLGDLDKPDFFVIDLDPSEDHTWDQIKALAIELKKYLRAQGLACFAKLSGGKGIHLRTPIICSRDYDAVTDRVKDLMKTFVRKHPQTTLRVHKDQRRGKILLDIYRNHPGNTIIAPYCLRARTGAPVAMPLSWTVLEAAESAQDFQLAGVIPHLEKHGDAWDGIGDSAMELFPAQGIYTASEAQAKNVKLTDYAEKRDFEQTSEPIPSSDPAVNGRFAVQLHDARNLHYDLRLGVDGVLWSWAIPKAFPSDQEASRLAIRTEDHPAKYIDFEGEIPAAEYGGGTMWLLDQGEFIWHKKEEKSLEFELKGSKLHGRYKLIHTRERQWLMRLVSAPRVKQTSFKPMLCASSNSLPTGKDLIYEVKWDGIRTLIYKDADETPLTIRSKSDRDISLQFPELIDPASVDARSAVLDAEIVCLDERGAPLFDQVISRLHRKIDERYMDSAGFRPKAYIYYFDILMLDGVDLTDFPMHKRHAILSAVIKRGEHFRVSDIFLDGQALYKSGKTMGLEGVMVKDKNGKYHPGRRTSDWIKVKYRQTIDAMIIGYTAGKGDRQSLFGALHLAQMQDDQWQYLGKLGTGFDHEKMREILAQLKALDEIKKPIDDKIEEESRTTWIEANLACEVQFASWTAKGTLREPVFLRMKEKI